MIELYYWTTPNGHKIADIHPRPAPAMDEGARKILFGQTARM